MVNKKERAELRQMLEDFDASAEEDSGSDGINELLEFVHWTRYKLENRR